MGWMVATALAPRRRGGQLKPVRERLLARRVITASGCWEWQGARMRSGYGVIRVRGEKQLVHRAAYEEFVAPIPAGVSVLHWCDNPPCFNPACLHAGTQAENIAEAVERSRFPLGAGARHHAKLTEIDVRDIRERHGRGDTTANLARQYAVHQSTIGDIIRRATWRDVA